MSSSPGPSPNRTPTKSTTPTTSSSSSSSTAARHSARQSLAYHPGHSLGVSAAATGLAGSTFSLPIPAMASGTSCPASGPSSPGPAQTAAAAPPPHTPTEKTASSSKSGKSSSSSTSLSMDRAAFLLIRIKRAFQKKKRNRNLQEKLEAKAKQKPPLLRAKTLPAIIPPALSIISAQFTKNVPPPPGLFNDYANVPSPELLSASGKDGAAYLGGNQDGTSPRHSVSSNSSTGSGNNFSVATAATSKEKKGLSKLTRLLSNNPGHKISSSVAAAAAAGTTSSGSSSPFTSAIFWHRSSNVGTNAGGAQNAALCQDGFSDSSCFFWNNRSSSSKLKRTGSMDSLLSTNQIKMNTGSDYDSQAVVGGQPGQGDSAAGGGSGHRTSVVSGTSGDLTFALDSPPITTGCSGNRHFLLSSKNSNLSVRSNRSTISMLTYQDGRLMFGDEGGTPLSPFHGQHSFYAGRVSAGPGGANGKYSSGGGGSGSGKDGKGLGKQRHQSIDINNGGIVLNNLKKSDRKKLNNLNFIYERALSSAVASEQLNLVKMVFENTNVDVNSEDEDGLTPLDIAVMLRNTDIIKYLQKRGAQEGDKWRNNPNKEAHLARLLNEAKAQAWELDLYMRQMMQMSASGGGGGGSGLSSALMREKETQLTACQRKVNLMERLLTGLQLLEPPSPPLSVQVEAVGETSLLVHYLPPIRLKEKKNIITRYKIEWSNNEFATILASYEITNFKTERNEFTIRDLKPNEYYYVRIASGNFKGYSNHCYPLIEYAVPSSWKSLDNRQTITDTERANEIDQLLKKVVNIRQDAGETDSTKSKLATELDSSMAGGSGGGIGGGSNLTKQSSDRKVRMSFKTLNFFGTPNRFHKTMKRGVYFACFVYHRDRVLVTNEEVLPIVEIDENFSSSFQADFNWLLKISCTWEDAKALRKDYAQLEKMQNTAAHFRCRILLAIEQMQNSLGVLNLGTMFHKPLRDAEGTVVFCSVRSLEDSKTISALSLRWLPLEKLHKRLAALQQQAAAKEAASFSERISDSGISLTGPGESRLIGEILLATLNEMMEYHQACSNKLGRGLYIGYLRLKSTLDLMSVMVSKSHPNTLPYAKIRENAHVSRLEWMAVRQCLTSDTVPTTGTSMLTKSLLPTSASQLHLATISQQQQQPTTDVNAKTLAPPSADGANNNNSTTSSLSPLANSGSSLNLRLPGPSTPSTPNSNTTPLPHLTNFLNLVQNASPKKATTEDEDEAKEPTPTSLPFGLTLTEKLTFQKLLKFLQAVTQAAGHLLQQLGVTEGQLADVHRFYSMELIELSPDISFILLLPPPEEVCTIFNQADCLQMSMLTDQIYLPLKIFEIIHMNTYQPSFTSKYSRVSALLELEIEHARHENREAFYSNNENTTRARLCRLQEYQKQLDENCRSLRWIMDVINYARSRELIVGVPLADVQQVLRSIDRQLAVETAVGGVASFGKSNLKPEDGRADFLPPGPSSIPFISLSSPGDYPEDNVNELGGVDRTADAGEEDSTTSSGSASPPPPAIPPPADCLSRRKSRDDSYLEEISRQQQHLQNIHHHPHHPRFHQFHQLNRSESLDSNDMPMGATTNKEEGDEVDRDQSKLQPTTMTTATSAPPVFVDPMTNLVTGAGYECSKSSSYSLLDSIKARSREQSLTVVDKDALDDMRRCVSASRLLTTTTTIMNARSGGGGTTTATESASCASGTPSPEFLMNLAIGTDYYYQTGGGGDATRQHSMARNSIPTMNDNTRKTPSVHSVDSEVGIILGGEQDEHTRCEPYGSQMSVNSIALDEAIYSAGTSRRQSDELSLLMNVLPPSQPSPGPMRYDYTENYRPLSRVQFTNEYINEPLAEEDEEELLSPKEESFDSEHPLDAAGSAANAHLDPFQQPIVNNDQQTSEQSSLPPLSFHDNFVDILSLSEPPEPARRRRRSRSGSEMEGRQTQQWYRFDSIDGQEQKRKKRKSKKRKRNGQDRNPRHCAQCCCAKKSDYEDDDKVEDSEEESDINCKYDDDNRDRSNGRRRTRSSCADSRPSRGDSRCSLGDNTTTAVKQEVCLYTAFQCEALPLGSSIRVKVGPHTLVGDIIETIIDHCRRHRKPSKHPGPLRLQAPADDDGRARSKSVEKMAKRFRLLAVYASNVKQLNWNFAILGLHSPWDEAKLCLKVFDTTTQQIATGSVSCKLADDSSRTTSLDESMADGSSRSSCSSGGGDDSSYECCCHHSSSARSDS